MDKEALGRLAFEAFKRSWRSCGFNPDWCELDQAGQAHWIAAAEAVVEAAKGERPAPAAAPVQKPSIGRIVHYVENRYVDEPNKVYAAIIVDVHEDESVCLSVFTEEGEVVPHFYVKFTDAPVGSAEADGKWTWPART